MPQSQNFEFLRDKHPELAELGAFAELYAHTDPQSALVKLRTFTEVLVDSVYSALRLPMPLQSSLFDLLKTSAFQQAVPPVVSSKLDLLRVRGNKAAHGESVNPRLALAMISEAYDAGRWLFVRMGYGTMDACPPFTDPPQPDLTGASQKKLREEKKKLQQQMADQEAQLQQILSDLQAERVKAEAAKEVAARSQEELENLRAQGQQVADALHFDEAETRKKLVDTLLLDAGWKVGESKAQTEAVGQEVKVLHQPTASGVGLADYVLWGDNGKPLAVIEVKKTAKSAEDGRSQAKLYADGLEKMHGQRPIIFYTNGRDLFLWNDAGGEPPRKLYGFYSKDSLEYLHFQRANQIPLAEVSHDPKIINRLYQVEAVRRVSERFSQKHRKTLLVQATGTGKTRVAVALCDVLSRARWVKRILFLCDRKELRKQAHNVFKEFLPGEPRVYVAAGTYSDRDKRVYLATYPAMMRCFESFDVGFFDLVIADESHRSIYNRYRDLFDYFDALQVGLTATPVEKISRNTYRIFDCEDQNPTFSYNLLHAVEEGYLVPFRVQKLTTRFLREGIKYSQMSREQQEVLEEQEADADEIEHEAKDIDQKIFNKDTNRQILQNLMEHGIQDTSGQQPGKTIVFARNHRHALLLGELFDEMFPQYGGNFCRVIDNYDPRAEQLIDDFKDPKNELTVAISVDMLDTGIDVPEVVNLVFAKPLKSFVKFWQMIGRGTRLCQNLFGPGQHKKEFLIIDHWGNFEFFGTSYTETEEPLQTSLLQRLFETRVSLAEATQGTGEDSGRQDPARPASTFSQVIALLRADLTALEESKTIAVRNRWGEIQDVRQRGALEALGASTRAILRSVVAPLMRWINIRGFEDAYRFDLLMTRLELAFVKRSASFADYKDSLLEEVALLPPNLSQVRAKEVVVRKVKDPAFWEAVTFTDLETVRVELRGIIKHQARVRAAFVPRVIDVKDDDEIERAAYVPQLDILQMVAYRQRVQDVLNAHFTDHPTLLKIKRGIPVAEHDLEELSRLVLACDATVNLQHLLALQPEMEGRLDRLLRGIVGMESDEVEKHLAKFVQKYPQLSALQVMFLKMLKNHIQKYGTIELEKLYEPPFTTIHADGIDGIFSDDQQIRDLVAVLETFRLAQP